MIPHPDRETIAAALIEAGEVALFAPRVAQNQSPVAAISAVYGGYQDKHDNFGHVGSYANQDVAIEQAEASLTWTLDP